MSGLAWLLWLLLSAAVLAVSVWHYRRRETPGRGRLLLAGLRAAAVSLVVLLLFDPDLPAPGGVTQGGAQVLLDASLSMQLSAASGRTRWQQASEAARARAGDRPVLLFGGTSRPVAAGALPDTAPGDVRSLLLPGLQAAAEAGVRSVLVVTDGALEDADAVARWAPRLGLRIETLRVGDDVTNQSLAEVDAPQWADPGQPVTLDFAVAGVRADSAGVVVRRDGRVIARAAAPPAAAGRLSAGSVELRLDPPAGGDGWVRLDVALETEDAVPDDNLRTLYVQVGDEPGVALVSFRPDWEPRFLAPVLERSLGLPLRAYIRSATGRYARLAAGVDAGVPVAEADVRRAVDRGQLVVLHGLGPDAPGWAHDAAATARHVLIFPAGAPGDVELPARVGSEASGDFFPTAAVPPSPVASLLSDLDVGSATPLAGLRPAEPPPGAWAPLMVTRGRQGSPLPLALAGESAGRRWAVALASGYWQWAFRGGTERQLYARLWSALAGWLAQERTIAALPPIRPARMALPRGSAVPWVAPGITADSVHIVLTDEAASVVVDTVLATSVRDTLFTDAPAPGHYSYRARAFAGDTVTTGTGVLTIERYSPELARAPVDPARLQADATTVRGRTDDVPRGTPLHASAYPYLLLVALLAAEWILRRRWGLR